MNAIDIDLVVTFIGWVSDIRDAPDGPWVSTDEAMAAIECGRQAK